MSAFDPDKYFQARQSQTGTKFDDIVRARNAKTVALEAAVPQKQQALAQQAPKSWVDRLGLGDSAAGQAVNLAASLFSGASRTVGDILSLSGDALAGAYQSELSEEQLAAYNRSATDQALPGDLEILNGRVRATDPNSETVLQRIQRIEGLRGQAAGVDKAFDVSSVVERTNQDEMIRQLGDGFNAPWEQVTAGWAEGRMTDVATGLGQLIYRAGESAWDNPAAASEFIAENLPQLAIGAAGKVGQAALTASNVGYGVENYRKGIEKYAAENNGALPPEDVRQRMALAAASTVAAEQVGDLVSLKGMKALGKAADDAEEAARAGFKTSVLNIGKAAAGGTVSEAITEGFQTFAEGEAQLTPASAKDIYTGAAIGGLVGGGLTGGGRALAEIAGATPEQAAVAAQEQKKTDLVKAAADTGDVSALADPEAKTYDPRAAIGALQQNARKEGTTEDQRLENFRQAQDVVLKAQEDLEAASALLPSGKKQLQVLLDEAKQEGNAQEVDRLQKLIDLPVAVDQQAALKTITQKQTKLNKLYEQLDAFEEDNKRAASRPAEQIQAQLAAADAADATPEAVEAVIKLSMASPESISAEQAEQLASNISNSLTPEQRSYFRTLSQAKVAENQLQNTERVNKEVLLGDPERKQLGIQTYNQRFAAALKTGNKAAMGRQIAGLSSFLTSHEAKAKLATQALAKAQQERNEDGYLILRKQDGTWTVRAAPVGARDNKKLAKQVRDNGGLRIHMGSGDLPGVIELEANAIRLALETMQKARQLSQAPKAAPSSAPKPAEVPAPSPVAAAPVEAPAPTPVVEPATKPAAKQASETNETQAATAEAQPAAVADQSREETKPVEPPAQVAEAKQEEEAQPVAPEEVEDITQTEVAEDPVAEDPTLDVFGEASKEEGQTYQKRNLVADFMVQRATRQLGKVKNFLTKLRSGEVNLSDFLAPETQGELRANQEAVLKRFSGFARQMDRVFQDNAYTRAGGAVTANGNVPADFRYQSPVEFLVKHFKTGNKTTFELEENVRTAMSFAGFAYLDSLATLNAFNDESAVKDILGMPDEAFVSEEALAYFADKGMRQNMVVNKLGRAAVQALGLKAKKDAPADLMPRLESTLGMYILRGLEAQGLLEIIPVPMSEFQKYGGKSVREDQMVVDSVTGEQRKLDLNQYFVRPAKDAEGNLHSWILGIHEANKKTASFLDKLFGAEPMVKKPTTEPVKFSQTLTKNTRQGVPKVLASILDRVNAQANFINPQMMLVMNQFMESPDLGDLLAEMAGSEDENVPLFAVNKLKRKAKNDNLRRELERLVDFVENDLKLQNDVLELGSIPLYFEHEVWKTQRVGIATNAINPQSSKVHRHMLYRKAWETEVNLDDGQMLDNFKLRVLEGLGVKTEKKGNAGSLALFNAMFDANDPSHKKAEEREAAASRNEAVDVLVDLFQGVQLEAADLRALARGVKAGDENFHSLSALVAMANYRIAVKEGRPSFTSRLMGEIDGVTNGPMLSHLLLGAAKTGKELMGLLNRGGFYAIGDQYTQYSQFRSEKGNQDLYETTIGHVLGVIEQSIQERSWLKNNFDALSLFTGDLGKEGAVTSKGRNIIKKPLTAFHFGSSLEAAVDGMADGFIESVMEKFEALAKDDDREGTKNAIEALNRLFWQKDADEQISWPVNASPAQILKRGIKPEEIKALKASFSRLMGWPVKAVFKDDFADFIEQRQQLNDAAQLSYELYNAVLVSERDKFLAELVEKNQIPVNGAGKPIADLNQEQMAEFNRRVKKAIPIMDTLMSKRSGSLASGMKMAKSSVTTRIKETSPLYASSPKVWRNGKLREVSVQSEELVEESPGVAMVVTGVHSLDSAISHFAAALGDVLNIHDAHGAGVANFQQTGQNLNQSTWNALLDYSPAREIFNGLDRTVRGFADLAATNSLKPEAAEALKVSLLKKSLKEQGWKRAELAELDKDPALLAQEMAGFSAEGYLVSQLQRTLEVANKADEIKLDVLSNLQSIDQYALEGGSYFVSDADRAEASSRKSGLTQELSASTLAAAQQVAEALETKGEPKVSGEEAMIVESQDFLSVEDEEAEYPGFDPIYRPVQVLQLLEAALLDRNLSDEAKDAAQTVRQAVLSRTVGTFERALAMVPRDLAGTLRSFIKEKRESIPRELWNELGTPAMQSDAQLVALFEERGELSADQALTWLGQHFSATGQDFNLELTKQLRNLVDAGLKVRYVTSATALELLLDKPVGKSRGWYIADGRGSKEIYVMSPEFVHSGLTPEVLLHELTHAGLANTIAVAQQRNRNSHDRQMVDELEALRELAIKFLEDKPELRRELGNATADVQELVAWGMSNRTFQTEVLAKIEMSTKLGAKVEKRTGAVAFIKSLVGLLFRGITQARENGLSVLLSNVAGLYDTAAKAKTPAQAAINQSQASSAPDPMHRIGQWSTYQIFDALASTAPGQPNIGSEANLRDLLGEIVGKLHGAFGYFKANLVPGMALTPLDVWQKALATGETPFASEVVGRVPMSDQEAFVLEQVEATVRAALSDNESHTSIAYNELVKLYREVSDKLTVQDFHDGDWNTATQDQKDAAQEFYNLVFEVKSNNGDMSNYLSRFVALGLANGRFNKILSIASDRYITRRQDETFEQRLHSFFRRILNWFNRKYMGAVPGEPINASLRKVVQQLVDIEAKKRRKLAMPTPLGKFKAVEDAAAAGAQKVRNAVAAAAGSEFVRNSRNGIVQGAGAVARVVVNEQVEKVLEGILQFRDQHFKESQGIGAGLVNYLKGPLEHMQSLLREAKHHEKQRKEAITDVAKSVLGAFKDAGKDLSEQAKQAVTRSLVRTGAHVLLGQFSLAQIDELLSDKKALDDAIKAQIGKLSSSEHAGYYVQQAHALGYYLVTNRATSPVLMFNAFNIASLAGSSKAETVTPTEVAAAEPVIDVLATLYSFKYLAADDVVSVREVMRAEAARTDGGNGVEMVLKMHRALEIESRQRLFGAERALMMKGYTPEIYNPHTDVKVARTAEERESLDRLGYSVVGDVSLDPDDPDQSKATLHVLKDGGLAPHLTGTIAYDGKAAKGSKVYGGQGFFDADALQNQSHLVSLTQLRQQQLDQMIVSPNPGWSPKAIKGTHMVPVMGPTGQITAWRYLMQSRTRDTVLERNNRFEENLGALAGSIMGKETAQTQNEKVVQALRDLYEQDYATRPDSYVQISANSPDREMREIYRLLPDDTQEAIRKIWGSDGMRVPYDLLDITFGYRKLSLAKAFDKKERAEAAARKGEASRKEDDLNPAEEFLTWFVEHTLYSVAKFKGMDHDTATTYSKRGAVVIRRGERIWQELVREVKDIIVVKTGVVLLGNIKSNISLLVVQGVPLKEIFHHHKVALSGALDYQRDRAALAQLELKLGSGFTRGDEAKIQREITILKDAIARNPVKELIDAGLMPTIVEDVAAEEDLYSYKSLFARKVSGFTDKLNSKVVTAGKWIYMSHDTPAYRTLSQITQLSDFVARYTLYQHLTNRKEKPLSKPDAIQFASEAFVNYDIPMHRSLQYLDDMGIMPFTKYFLSIQRVLLKLGREQPARILMTILLGNYFSGLDVVTDSSMLARIGNNPLDAGALKYPFVLDDLATANAALSLIK